METLYRTRDVRRRRAPVGEALAPARPTGPRRRPRPGFYVEELLDVVGPDGSVVGVDASPEMLAAAAASLCGPSQRPSSKAMRPRRPSTRRASTPRCACRCSSTSPTHGRAQRRCIARCVPAGASWCGTSTGCTVSWHSEDPERMERVLRAWDAHLTHPSLPRTLGARLRAAGFTRVGAEGHLFATTALGPRGIRDRECC